MTAPLIVVAAIFGLVFGSFVTALTYRLPRGISIAHGRSACPACGHALTWRDLFPVLSWAISGGRCRYCGVGVSWRYPAIELTSAVLFAAAAWGVLGPERSLILLAMTPFLLALVVLDLEHGILPNILIVPLAILALLWRWRTGSSLFQGIAIAAVIGVLAILLEVGIQKISDGAAPLLGGGDAKLLAIGALAFPLSHFFLFLTVAGFIGCVFGVIWQQTMKTKRFPFAPGLCVAFWAVAWAGNWLPF